MSCYDANDGTIDLSRLRWNYAAIYARRLAKKEGILAGYSCGAAIAGLHQLKSNFKKNENVVVLLHDSGTRYIGKVYNDEWMKKQGFKLD